MDTISRDSAEEIAKAKVQALGEAAGDAFALTNEVCEVEQGWVFFFNSADYVSSGDYLDALVGNGPLLVQRDGRVMLLPSALPWEQVIAAMPSRQQAEPRQDN